MRKSLCLILSFILILSCSLTAHAFPNLTTVGSEQTDSEDAFINKPDAIHINIGDSYVFMKNIDNSLSYMWLSSNNDIVKVSEDGVIYGLKNGSATVTFYDVNFPQIATNIQVIVGTGIEDVIFYTNDSVQTQGKITGYVGPGFSIIAFETGLLHTSSSDEKIKAIIEDGAKAFPAAYGNADYPSYGHLQMIETNIREFESWMLSSPSRAKIWNKLFKNVAVICQTDSEFTHRWKNAYNYLTKTEYQEFGHLQIEFVYRQSGLYDVNSKRYKMIAATGIDPNRSRVLQEFFFMCYNQGAFSIAFKEADVNGDMSDKEIIERICRAYGTCVTWGAGLTKVMRNKWYGNGNGVIYRYFQMLADEELPLFSFKDVTGESEFEVEKEDIQVQYTSTKGNLVIENS